MKEVKGKKVGQIGNYYGGLRVMKDGNVCSWGIQDHDRTVWEEIPQALYDELLKFDK